LVNLEWHTSQSIAGVHWQSQIIGRRANRCMPFDNVSFHLQEKLSLAHNDLPDLPICVNDLTSLRSLSLRDNHVSHTQISARLFDNPDLSTLDLSHNNLQEFPANIENAKGLIVLNLSSNQ
jgi:hypothetical protein